MDNKLGYAFANQVAIKVTMKIKLLLVIVLSVLLLVLVQGYSKYRLATSARRWHQEMQNGNLIGKNPKAIISFLDSKNLSHGDYDLTHRSKSAGGVIYAGTEVVAKTFSVSDGPQSWIIEISFQFDANNKLNRYAVREKANGL